MQGQLRAIDLYAGVGGWSLGLQLAGIEVVASYEWWQPAVETHNKNLGSTHSAIDIRKLDLETLPEDIDLVVGSPPCTEFSYSNRGGNGNLVEGLIDLVRFFEAVDHVKPTYWVMENVPRVAEVLRDGFATDDHPLRAFAHLAPEIYVFDMADFGVPQARKRCIAGNIPFDLLRAYAPKAGRRTLGQVVRALAQESPVDPVWGVALTQNTLTEMETEPTLNGEELRMNREAKLYHPVYNNMSFPDDMEEPARTVTATCTRVSRESIVIATPQHPGQYRRLTVRERASLQGFPITYQFFGNRFSEKAKMVGNAIPPPFTFLIGHAALGTKPEDLPTFEEAGESLRLPEELPALTRPDSEGVSYPARRRFRAALPNLRFKSGMRFDLSNDFSGPSVAWRVRFYFGASTDVHEIELDGDLWRELEQLPQLADALKEQDSAFVRAAAELRGLSPEALQSAWTRASSGIGPFRVTDILGELGDQLLGQLETSDLDEDIAKQFVCLVARENIAGDKLPNESKLRRYALRILAGLVVGTWFNAHLERDPERVAA